MKTKKIKVAILFGGKSGEHEVSIVSAMSVSKALDKSKYDVMMIGIDKTGRWLLPDQAHLLAHAANPRLIKLSQEMNSVSFVPFESEQQIVSLKEKSPEIGTASKFDVVIPILHGTYGEDGTVQGLLELANIPYVGSGVLGSSTGMDKDVSRRLFAEAGLPVVKTKTIRKSEFQKNPQMWVDKMVTEFSFPHFIKPANMGSSVGVHKVKSISEALQKYKNAFDYDSKILVEESIQARELEVAVLGNDYPKASIVGEIIPTHEFYSYEAKYMDENGAKLSIPALNITESQSTQIRDMALKAFQVLECRGLARVDFFLDKVTGKIYLNEINTIPGFTSISMYPKLWEASGLPYSQLLNQLIDLALEKHQEKNSLKTTYESEI